MSKRRRVPGMLVIYHFEPPYAGTVLEHAASFGRYSRFPVFPVNTADGYPAGMALLEFDVVLLHYSLFGSSAYFLDQRFLGYLDATRAYKIAFFQDEYYYCRQRFAFLNRYAIDCVYSLLEPEHIPAVYGAHTRVRRVESTIPGLVSDDLVEHARRFAKPPANRCIDIGYRARRLPYYMGRGAQEKHEIGMQALVHAADSGLVLDIATDESSRLYNDNWYRFLGDCRAVLGVEAGVSIFDLDDVVRESTEALLATEPDLSFDQVHERILKHWEGNIPYRTVSPRHFEAAAFRCCQLLYEGHYSGVLDPMRHYIPLRKDGSNFDDVLAVYRDDAARERIVRAAFDELIASGKYSYRAFIGRFDAVLESEGLVPAPRGAWQIGVSATLERGLRMRRAVRSTRRRLRGLRARLRRAT